MEETSHVVFDESAWNYKRQAEEIIEDLEKINLFRVLTKGP